MIINTYTYTEYVKRFYIDDESILWKDLYKYIDCSETTVYMIADFKNKKMIKIEGEKMNEKVYDYYNKYADKLLIKVINR
jgi:hypothetical protein